MELFSHEKKIKLTRNLRPGKRKAICLGFIKHKLEEGFSIFNQTKPTNQTSKKTPNPKQKHWNPKISMYQIKLKQIKAENRKKKNKQAKLNQRVCS